jgi:hypothetical protein
VNNDYRPASGLAIKNQLSSSDKLLSLLLLLHEVTNELCNLIHSSVEREMTGIEDVAFIFVTFISRVTGMTFQKL